MKSKSEGLEPRRTVPYIEGEKPRRVELCGGSEGPNCEESSGNREEPKQQRPKAEGLLSIHANPCGSGAGPKWMKSMVEVNNSGLDMP